MIELKPVPAIDTCIYGTPPRKGNHIFDLTDYDITIYYNKIFYNRTCKNKMYIVKFTSTEELEEDIYGMCTHKKSNVHTTKSFREIYNSLNKEEFLNKINAMVGEYGNAIISDIGIDMCVKTNDNFLRLREYYR